MRLLACFIIFLMMCGTAFADPWYEGGSLQKATVYDWQHATPDNQLATSADFIASLSAITDIATVQDQETLIQIRKKSEELRNCVNQAILQGDNAEDTPIANLIVLCTLAKKK